MNTIKNKQVVNNAAFVAVDRQLKFISQKEVNFVAFLPRFAFGFAVDTKIIGVAYKA